MNKAKKVLLGLTLSLVGLVGCESVYVPRQIENTVLRKETKITAETLMSTTNDYDRIRAFDCYEIIGDVKGMKRSIETMPIEYRTSSIEKLDKYLKKYPKQAGLLNKIL